MILVSLLFALVGFQSYLQFFANNFMILGNDGVSEPPGEQVGRFSRPQANEISLKFGIPGIPIEP